MSTLLIEDTEIPVCFRELSQPKEGFYKLSSAEARRLGNDMLHTRLEAGRGRMHEKATFRLFWDQDEVQKNPPGHRDHLRYAVYNAKELWQWQKNNVMDPTRSFEISWEDWKALYHRFNNGKLIPEWVGRLKRVEWPDVAAGLYGEVATWVRNENAYNIFEPSQTRPRWEAYVNGALRFQQLHPVGSLCPKDGVYFQGAPGEEYAVFVKQGNMTLYFRGAKGQEYAVHSEIKNRNGATHKIVYEPIGGPKRMGPNTRGRSKYPGGFTAKGRKVKEVVTYSGQVGVTYTGHFTGPRGQERVTHAYRDVIGKGRLEIRYKGPKGHEAKYFKYNWLTAEKAYYRGAKGKERLWKRFIAGYEFLFKGPKGHEALRSYYPASDPDGGERHWFAGPKGQERSCRVRGVDGVVRNDDGSLGRPDWLMNISSV
tara:strand:- start:36 stop:1310 length:1275 start_codon:yes stop_codon:yes gene_type:complete